MAAEGDLVEAIDPAIAIDVISEDAIIRADPGDWACLVTVIGDEAHGAVIEINEFQTVIVEIDDYRIVEGGE